MTSQLDDGGLHPMVSTLLGGGTIPRAPTKTYNREIMMELRTTKLSMTRPENLSEEFNGEDGKFSPLKWLEHRWDVEGVKNRPMSKKIDSLCAGADDNTGFSPQRRAFSSGCKAPQDDKGRDEYERLGGHGKNWRNGSTGGSDKFASRGNDFKTSFQKGGQLDRGARGTDWKKDAGGRTGTKFGQRREDRMTSASGSEKLPEWADGPTTMDDMIELRGFDEPKKGKNKKNSKDKKEKETSSKPSDSIPECTGSRPSSTGLKPIDDPAIAFSSAGSGALPETDHELAALLGCLDIQKTSRKDDESWPQNLVEPEVNSSRLSRFFGKKSKSPELDAMLSSSSGNDENIANPMLAKLFGQASGDSGEMKSAMRLEDLEKGFEGKEPASSSKMSPLQDPAQQAQLLQHLQKVAKQQVENPQHLHQQRHSPNIHQQHPMHHPMVHHPGVPIVADPALLASFAQNPMVLNAYCENQLQEAINAAMRANHGQSIPPQLHEQLRMASNRNKMFLQSQTLAFVGLQQQQHQNNLQQHHQQQKGRTPAMIPASVQRHLQKTSSNAAEQKKEKSQSPSEEENDVASQMKKLHMQQTYNTMVQAMNSGVGWPPRGNGAAGPPQQQQQQQLPPNVQMLMAQQQQAQMHHHMKMMASRHQQMVMAKLMHIQQQQAQMAMQERQVSQNQQQAVPSELSQVGPIQTPLEKLLASVGVQGSHFTGSGDRLPSSARPMSLEDLEKQLTAAQQQK